MSWRDTAKRVLAGGDGLQEAPSAPAETFTPYERDEREAIATIDGGLPPEWAAALSMLLRPEGITARDWAARLERVWLRADQCAVEFAANGWTFADVFGVSSHWARLDYLGAAWLCEDGRIVEITPLLVIFERSDGHRTTHHKPGRAH